MPEYFLNCLPENQVVLPTFSSGFFFGPKKAISTILRGGGGGGGGCGA